MSAHQRVNPFSPSALRFHVPLLIGVAVCLFAGWFELTRARGGHTVAWVYAFEWPAFAIAGIFIWWRIIRNRDEPRLGPSKSAASRHDVPANDPGLAAWQEYLTEVRRRDQAHDADETS